MAEIVQARVWQKVDTYNNWMANDLILGKGEMALVIGNGGIPLNMRWGDGTKVFRDLPNAIAYDQGQFVAVTGTTLPAVAEVGYTILGGGTYTQTAGGNVVVPDGKLGVLVSEGDTWSLQSEVELPTVEGVDIINPNGSRIPTEKAVVKYSASKESIGLTSFVDGESISIELESKYVNSDFFISGFLRPSGTIGESIGWEVSANKTPIIEGEYITNLCLESTASMLIYNSSGEIISVFQNKGRHNGIEEWNFTVPKSGVFYRTSRSINSIAKPVDFYIKSIGDKSMATDKTFIPSLDFESKIEGEFNKRGFIEIIEGTNLLEELNGSNLDNPLIWGVGFLHYNGSINPSSTWRYSINNYRVYPGKYNIKSSFNGNARIWVLDIDGNIVRTIENNSSNLNYSKEETFSSIECYIKISFASTSSTDNIECKALSDINYFEGSSSVNVTSSVLSNDFYNAVNGHGVSSGIISALKSSVKKMDKFPVVTFISDDLHLANWDWYIPYLDSKNVKGTFAFITGRDGVNPNYATSEQVRELFNQGHDIASHTDTHRNTADLSEQDQESELRDSKIKIMQIIGDNCPVLVPPFGSQSLVTERIARKYYDISVISIASSLVATGQSSNDSPLDSYRMKRVSFDQSGVSSDDILQLCKDAVDTANSKKEWLLFAVHPQYDEYSELLNPNGYIRRRQDLLDLIDYIKSLNIPIMTAKNALSLWGNTLELGTKRLEDNYYTVGMNGVSEGDYFSKQ